MAVARLGTSKVGTGNFVNANFKPCCNFFQAAGNVVFRHAAPIPVEGFALLCGGRLFTVKGGVRHTLTTPLKILGAVINDCGSWLLPVKGTVSNLFFLDAVPRRLQRFFSSKIWFRSEEL